MADARLRIPMEDLRAVVIVFPRLRRHELRRMRTIDGLLEAFRIDALTRNPHAECRHNRGICAMKERAYA